MRPPGSAVLFVVPPVAQLVHALTYDMYVPLLRTGNYM